MYSRILLCMSLTLLMIALSDGATFFVLPTAVTDEDGNVSYSCNLGTEEDPFTITDKKVYIPNGEKYCAYCDPCTEYGSGCADMFRPCPTELKENEEFWIRKPRTTRTTTRTTTQTTQSYDEEIEVQSSPSCNEEIVD